MMHLYVVGVYSSPLASTFPNFSNSPAYFDVLKERFLGKIFVIVEQPNKTSQNLRPKTKFRQKSRQVSCLLLLPPLMTFDHTVDLVGDFVC